MQFIQDVLNKLHPPRPAWYEELYALVLDQGMKAYEAEVICRNFLHLWPFQTFIDSL